jgi:CBS domain-containing protein
MRVFDAMTRTAQIVSPSDTLQTASRIMCEQDIGFLPVGENDRLVGTITDRDIAVRAVAGGCAPWARVGDFMTRGVKYCFEDDDLDDVLDHMKDQKVRRMPVLNRNKRLVGVLSLSDAAFDEPEEAGETLRAIAKPGGAHSQRPIYREQLRPT